MTAEQQAGSTAPSISQLIASQDHWYVNFTSLDADHNNHLVIAWAVMSDNKTLVPYISSPDNQKDIVAASQISADYIILNPYSQCPACVRPEIPAESASDPLVKVQQDLKAQATHSIPKGFA
jgi:predicted GH43/DUF377 family glycosyl hydrolase